jgi:diguanylate cyclase (GGDEF)-like protein
MEKRYLHADGSVVWAQLSVSLVRDDEGRPLHFVSQVTDISERKRLEAELRRLATHDDLTGLHNRRAFEREIERQLRRVKRYAEQGAVLLADLDDFKSVNDTLGHHAGDELLRHVAALLTRRLRESDIVARLGGDEFAVLLTHTDLAAAEALARSLEAELAGHPLRIDGAEVVAHASIGAAALDADVTPEDALRHADRAMYAVKRARRLAGPERRERRD